MNIHPVAHVLHIGIHSSALLAKLHYRADIFARAVYMHIRHRLKRLGYNCRIGVVCGVIHRYGLTVRKQEFILNARRGGNKIEIILAFEPFLDDFHMQKPQKAAAEAEAERL